MVTLYSSVDNVTDTALVARITQMLRKHPALNINGTDIRLHQMC